MGTHFKQSGSSGRKKPPFDFDGLIIQKSIQYPLVFTEHLALKIVPKSKLETNVDLANVGRQGARGAPPTWAANKYDRNVNCVSDGATLQ